MRKFLLLSSCLVASMSVYAWNHVLEVNGMRYGIANPDNGTCGIMNTHMVLEDGSVESITDPSIDYAGSIDIPSEIVSPDDYMTADFPSGSKFKVVTIEPSCFNGCENLTAVSVPNSVTSIGNGAFGGCSNLSVLSLSSSITRIGDGAFGRCTSLSSVVLPNSVTTLGSGTFSGCTSLDNVELSSELTKIESCVFEDCQSLGSIDIPFNVVSIGNSAFKGCSSLTTVILPESLSVIDDNAFSGCFKLRSVIIPESVTSIGNDVFKGSSSISFLTCDALVPPTIGYGDTHDLGLTASQYQTIDVQVPEEAIEAYRNAPGWSKFTCFQNDITTAIDNVIAAEDLKVEAGRYDLSGRAVGESYQGIFIIRYTDGSACKVMR